MKRILILAAALSVWGILYLKTHHQEVMLTGRAMGCEWKFKSHESLNEQEVRNQIAMILEHWEQVLSTWRPDSDLSRHNRGEAASADLKKVIRMAEQLHEQSRGAFDHRLLAELTRAGFGPGGKGMDLSSLGKGHAVDEVCKALEQSGIHHYIFSLAGEMRAGKGTWPVILETPDSSSGPSTQVIELSEKAIASSGNYQQWNRKVDGKLASHIIDPRTGTPVMRPPCRVTVTGPSAALASGWATALFVLGPDETSIDLPEGFEVIWQR